MPSSVGFQLATDIADAINAMELYDETATVSSTQEIVVGEDWGDSEYKILVSPTFSVFEREARVAAQETQAVRVVVYKVLSSRDVDEVSAELLKLEQVAAALAVGECSVDDRIYVVTECEVEAVDEQLLAQNLIYCGTIQVALTTGAAGIQ